MFFNAGLSSMCHTQLLSCFLAFILCMRRHPLTISGNASSTYIHTTHGTKLLKMPLFPIITYEQHRDMLWSHPHILVPLSTSVLHRMMYEYNFFGLFVCFSAGKTWILYRIKSCSSQKGTTIDTPLQQDKTRMTNDIQAFPLSMLLGKWIYKRAGLSLDVLLYGYVDLTGSWL